VKVLVFAAVLAALAVAPAQAGNSPTCGAAAAKRAITATHLRMKLLGPLQTIDPSSADKVICYDFTRDGRTDMAVTIASGGTAGDVGWVLFRAIPTGWAVVKTSSGYKLGLFRTGGDLVNIQPIYKSNDANCCPTGGFDHTQYHWNGKSFVMARNWHTKTFKP
jgi:hypothetical protein